MLRTYIATHLKHYEHAQAVQHMLPSAICEIATFGPDAVASNPHAFAQADLHIFLLSQDALREKAFRQRYAQAQTAAIPLLTIGLGALPAAYPVDLLFDDALPQHLQAVLAVLHEAQAVQAHKQQQRDRFSMAAAGIALAVALLALVTLTRMALPEREPQQIVLAALPTYIPTQPNATALPTNAAETQETQAISEPLSSPAPSETAITSETEEPTLAEEEDPSALLLSAEFLANPVFGVVPLTVTLDRQTEGPITEFAWDFDGDGVIDDTNADLGDVAYNEAGEYLLSLTVTDAAGAQATHSVAIFVYDAFDPDEDAPSADDNTAAADDDTTYLETGTLDFFVAPAYGEAPLSVTMTNMSDGDFVSYAWDFEADNVVDSRDSNSPTHVYTQAGEFTVVLIAETADGEEYRSFQTVYVDAPLEPLAFMSAAPDYGEAPLTVTFSDESEGIISSYAWDFDGDGVTDSTAASPPPYTYTEGGDYEARLTVTGPGGSTDYTWPVYVEGAEAPYAWLHMTPRRGNAPLTVSFSNYSDGSINSYEWDFDGDGVADSTARVPSGYTFEQPGDHLVTLKVSGPGGISTDSMTVYVTGDAPEAAFSTSATSGPAPLSVTFTNQSSGGTNLSYQWDFDGDGTTDSTQAAPPAYIYNEAGSYEATLTVINAAGTSDSTSVTIVVSAAEATAEVTAELTPEITAEVTAEPTDETTPDVTPEVTAEPTAEPTPDPTAEVTAETTPDVTPEPTAETTPEPSPSDTPEVTAEPSAEATPEATETDTPAPEASEPVTPEATEASSPAPATTPPPSPTEENAPPEATEAASPAPETTAEL